MAYEPGDFVITAIRTHRTYRTYQIRILEGRIYDVRGSFNCGYEISQHGQVIETSIGHDINTPTSTLLQAAYHSVNQLRKGIL